jgi:hypothetical protein
MTEALQQVVKLNIVFQCVARPGLGLSKTFRRQNVRHGVEVTILNRLAGFHWHFSFWAHCRLLILCISLIFRHLTHVGLVE